MKRKLKHLIAAICSESILLIPFILSLITGQSELVIIAIGGATIIITLTAVFVIYCVIPGRKAMARVADKSTQPCKDPGMHHIMVRVVVFDHDNKLLELYTDEWDYNHLSIGDQLAIEYKKDSLISFDRIKSADCQEQQSKMTAEMNIPLTIESQSLRAPLSSNSLRPLNLDHMLGSNQPIITASQNRH